MRKKSLNTKQQIRNQLRFLFHRDMGKSATEKVSFLVILPAPFIDGLGDDVDGRIVGGFPLEIEWVPYHAYLNVGCGGVILSKRHVATAAHCFLGERKPWFLRVGTKKRFDGGQIVKIKEYFSHPKYVNANHSYDFGLVVLEEDLVFSDSIKPIDLASEPAEDETYFLVSGWGAEKESQRRIPSPYLLGVLLPQVNFDECEAMYKDKDPIDESMFCAGFRKGRKDACDGDSGGPVVVNNTLYGLVSWGDGCSRPLRPGVFANIPVAYDWYMSFMQK